MAKKKAPKSPRKQQELPEMSGEGVAPLHIAELDDLASKYASKRDRRIRVQREEIEANKDLKEALKRHERAGAISRTPEGALVYEAEETYVSLTPTDEVLKVKAKPEEE